MHPLNTFPFLLDFIRLGPFILRLVVGIFIISLGLRRKNKDYSWLSVFYFIFGATIMIGFYTQISSIVGIVLLKTDFYLEYWRRRKTTSISINYYFLYTIVIIVLLSLLVTGAGHFAFDMPF